MDSTVIRMDIISYSRHLARDIEELISQSDMTRQQVAEKSGIAWTTFSRRIGHPETSYLTVTEVIAICSVLGKDFINVLKAAEEQES